MFKVWCRLPSVSRVHGLVWSGAFRISVCMQTAMIFCVSHIHVHILSGASVYDSHRWWRAWFYKFLLFTKNVVPLLIVLKVAWYRIAWLFRVSEVHVGEASKYNNTHAFFTFLFWWTKIICILLPFPLVTALGFVQDIALKSICLKDIHNVGLCVQLCCLIIRSLNYSDAVETFWWGFYWCKIVGSQERPVVLWSILTGWWWLYWHHKGFVPYWFCLAWLPWPKFSLLNFGLMWTAYSSHIAAMVCCAYYLGCKEVGSNPM